MLLLARCCWNRISTFFVFIVIRYLSVGAAAGDLTRLWGFGNPLRSSLPPRRLESRSRDRLRRKPRDRDTGDIRPDRDCFIQEYFFLKNQKNDPKNNWISNTISRHNDKAHLKIRETSTTKKIFIFTMIEDCQDDWRIWFQRRIDWWWFEDWWWPRRWQKHVEGKNNNALALIFE